jgi:hypothetical protein
MLRAFVLALVLMACACGACRAQAATTADEYQVKAAFLYKFLNFVAWPPEVFERRDTPLVIGVLGADALAQELARVVAQRTVIDRPVTVRKLLQGQPVTGLHVLFVGRDMSAQVAMLSDSAQGQALLIVSESDEAFARGSTINFVVVDNKVRFDVALRPAERARLKISSRLLAVARHVITGSS